MLANSFSKKIHVWICCVVVLVAACKKSGGGDHNPPNTPAVTPVGAPIGAARQQEIGPAGGTIVSEDGRFSLVIPQQALETSQTISVQAIESKLPTGLKTYRFLPHGLVFKKNVQAIWNYGSEEELGSDANGIHLATQEADGKWRIIKNKVVDAAANTITVNIEHFSDYSFFTDSYLQDDKTMSHTGTITLKTNERIGFGVTAISMDANDVFVPIPGTYAALSDWQINGNLQSPDPLMFGSFIRTSKDSAIYKAPGTPPAASENLIAISAKATKNQQQVTLVRHVTIQEVNSFKWNGTSYDLIDIGGTFGIANNGSLSLAFPTNHANVALGIAIMPNPASQPPFAGYTGPGTYNFSQKTIIMNLTNESGLNFTNHSGNSSTTGTIQILPGSGTHKGDHIYGRIQGTLKNIETGAQGTVEVTFEGVLG